VDDEGNYKWPKLNLIQTFQFKPGLMFGIGVGLQNNHIYRDNYLFPFFVAFRAQSSYPKQVEPFFSFYVGYTGNPDKPISQGGYFVNSQAGVDIKLNRKSSVYLGAGIELKRAHVLSWFNWGNSISVDFFHLSFSLGFSF
jgi:opacity protein-like surface antigen